MGIKPQEVEIWLRCAAIKNCKWSNRLNLVQSLLGLSSVTLTELQRHGLNKQQIDDYGSLSTEEWRRVEAWLSFNTHHFITYHDQAYPQQLKHCASAPLFMFAIGDVNLLQRWQLAVVGSRSCTYYGKFWTEKLVSDLCLYDIVITSGLALGIDALAHKAALLNQRPTIAVLGSGLDIIYPRQNQGLYQEIIANGGLVVSEFPLHMPPKAANFPRRNRIISGLSIGILVVEASMRSGSLITARYGLEQNRNIYVVPGSLNSSESAGCHWLIQQGGLLIRHAQDIVDDLRLAYPSLLITATKQINFALPANVPLPFAHLLANVGDEVTPVDVVAARTGQPVPEIVAGLLELELAGWITAVPGGYVRLRRACHV